MSVPPPARTFVVLERLLGDNRFTGTLPDYIKQTRALQKLCVGSCVGTVCCRASKLSLVGRDVAMNFFEGDVSAIAQMPGYVASGSQESPQLGSNFIRHARPILPSPASTCALISL